MIETSAHLVDHVIPEVPVRQSVLSFPWRLRLLFASRLAAFVPRPRVNLTRCHGVFAPGSPIRRAIVPVPARARRRKPKDSAHAQATRQQNAAEPPADTGAYYVAMTYAHRGDHDRAIQWLERSYEQRDPGLPEIVGEHLFSGMANDPRFKAFLRKLKLLN